MNLEEEKETTWDFYPVTVGDFNEEINFPHKLLLTNGQVSKLCKYLVNNLSANIKLSTTRLSKTIQ